MVLVSSLQGQRTYSMVKENNLYVAVMAIYFMSMNADREFLP